MSKRTTTQDYMNMPETLDDHIFYGLTLDDDQKAFRDAIWDKDNIMVICESAAGTGKTTIAMCTANMLVHYGQYKRIVYVRNTGCEKKLGYLPGDIEEKSRNYMTAGYQALEMAHESPSVVIGDDFENEKCGAYVQFTTDTFFRGINIKNAVVIFDEYQNYNIPDIRTALTRCGDDCKVILCGSHRQVDLDVPTETCVYKVIGHFKNEEWCKVCELTHNHRGKLSAKADELK